MPTTSSGKTKQIPIWGLLIFFIVLGIFSGISFLSSLWGLNLTGYAQGQIVDVREGVGLRQRTKKIEYRVAYTNPHGQFTFVEETYPFIATFRVGDAVEVIYDPSNSLNARIRIIFERERMLFGPLMIAALIGIVFLLFKFRRSL